MLQLIRFSISVLFFLMPLGVFAQDAAKDLAAYKKSPAANPAYDSYVEEGFKALEKGDIATTVDRLKKAIGGGSTSPLVSFKLALAFEAMRSYYSCLQFYDLAREQFAKMNGDHPYNKQFDEHYGRALYMSGQTAKALPVLEKAAQTSQSYWVLKLLGEIAFSQGKMDNGVSYFEKALGLADPNLTGAERVNMLIVLARLSAENFDVDGAKRCYGRVLEIDPSNKEAGDYIKSQTAHEQPSADMDPVFEIFENH